MNSELLGKLESASVRKSFSPDADVEWGQRPDAAGGPVLAIESLSIAGTPFADELSETELALLARHEVSSMFSAFIRFEGVLNQALARQVRNEHPDSPRIAYMLHIVEEEARHSRMFARLISELGVGGYPPSGAIGVLERVLEPAIANSSLFFAYSMLAVEAVTDTVLEQFLRSGAKYQALVDVCRIHRVEEARHIAFAREALADSWRDASRTKRFALRCAAPVVAAAIYEALVPPEVYRRAGIATGVGESVRIWAACHKSEQRGSLRRAALSRMRCELERVGDRAVSDRGWRLVGAGRTT